MANPLQIEISWLRTIIQPVLQQLAKDYEKTMVTPDGLKMLCSIIEEELRGNATLAGYKLISPTCAPYGKVGDLVGYAMLGENARVYARVFVCGKSSGKKSLKIYCTFVENVPNISSS